jgi:hypothetical protein
MQSFQSFKWVVPASKWYKRDPMRTTFHLLKGRGRWAQVLNVHVVEAVQIYQLLLLTLLVKVIVPAPSKLINRMTTTTTMKTYPWTLLRDFCLGHPNILVRQLKWAS